MTTNSIALTEVQVSKAVDAAKTGDVVFSANRFAQIIGINPSTFRSMLQKASSAGATIQLGKGIEAKRAEKAWEVHVPVAIWANDREPFYPRFISGMKPYEEEAEESENVDGVCASADI